METLKRGTMRNEMNRTRRRYTREFKEEAVRLSERGDKTVRQVAEDLGVSEKALHRWRSEMRISRQRGGRFAPGHGQARDEEVAAMCQVLRMSSSGYYAWRDRQTSQAGSARARANDALAVEIRATHKRNKQRYGGRKMRIELIRLGLGRRANHKQVARLMRENGLFSRRVRRRKVTTDGKYSLPIAPNVLNREFTATQPNRKWASDITYVPAHEGRPYLAVVMDLFARRVMGWAMRDALSCERVIAAFEQAVRTRDVEAGLLFHSDRGSQYAGNDFVERLGAFEVMQSMSRVADVYVNAVMERFFASYKLECAPERGLFDMRQQAWSETFQYIKVFYNRQRLHAALAPTEAEQAVGVA